eukprot:403341870
MDQDKKYQIPYTHGNDSNQLITNESKPTHFNKKPLKILGKRVKRAKLNRKYAPIKRSNEESPQHGLTRNYHEIFTQLTYQMEKTEIDKVKIYSTNFDHELNQSMSNQSIQSQQLSNFNNNNELREYNTVQDSIKLINQAQHKELQQYQNSKDFDQHYQQELIRTKEQEKSQSLESLEGEQTFDKALKTKQMTTTSQNQVQQQKAQNGIVTMPLAGNLDDLLDFEFTLFIKDTMRDYYDGNQQRGFIKCTCKACQILQYPIMISKDKAAEEFYQLHNMYLEQFISQDLDVQQFNQKQTSALKVTNIQLFLTS